MILGLDTEDLDGVPSTYALAGRGWTKVFESGPEGQDALLGELVKCNEADTHVNIWTLNLPYDVINLFEMDFPNVFTTRLAHKRIIGANVKGCGKIKFFAIERFLPKLDKMELGHLLGMKMQPLELEDPKRIVQDAEVARRAGEKIESILKKLKIPLTFSAGASAIKALELENGGKFQPVAAKIRVMGRQALYGGRTEPYYAGYWEQRQGQLFYFDFKACYARIMSEELPDPWQFSLSKEPKEKYYIAQCEIDVEDKNGIGPCPYKRADDEHGESLCFPTGRLSGTWTSFDLLQPGVTVRKYVKVVNFGGSGRFLADFVKRLLPSDSEHPIGKGLKKNLYTSLSGKFAQSNSASYFTHQNNIKPQDLWNGYRIGEWVICERKIPFPHHANQVWTAFINAKGRVYQWKLFEAIWEMGGSVLYSDTDNALCRLSGRAAMNVILKRFPDMLNHCSATWARIFGPKAYLFEDGEGIIHRSLKGIPNKYQDKIYTGDEEIEGESPDPFMSLIKTAKLNMVLRNKWRGRNYKISKAIRNRRVIAGTPWTEPIRILEVEKLKPKVGIYVRRKL